MPFSRAPAGFPWVLPAARGWQSLEVDLPHDQPRHRVLVLLPRRLSTRTYSAASFLVPGCPHVNARHEIPDEERSRPALLHIRLHRPDRLRVEARRVGDIQQGHRLRALHRPRTATSMINVFAQSKESRFRPSSGSTCACPHQGQVRRIVDRELCPSARQVTGRSLGSRRDVQEQAEDAWPQQATRHDAPLGGISGSMCSAVPCKISARGNCLNSAVDVPGMRDKQDDEQDPRRAATSRARSRSSRGRSTTRSELAQP